MPFLVWTCVSPIVRARAAQNASAVIFTIANAIEAVLLQRKFQTSMQNGKLPYQQVRFSIFSITGILKKTAHIHHVTRIVTSRASITVFA
ncbi:MAG TPA: hypothetical protein VK522_10945 [Pseudolabrys sp.]|nr:hypothetical protein [Pseudolabrys sp.]